MHIITTVYWIQKVSQHRVSCIVLPAPREYLGILGWSLRRVGLGEGRGFKWAVVL